MNPDEQKLIPFPLDHDQNAGALPEVLGDTELNTVLRGWTSPAPSADLDARVLESYRERTEHMPTRARLHRWISRALLGVAVAAGILAAIWTFADHQPLAAMELLEQSRRADARFLSEPSAIVHRVCAYEERRMDGAVLERRRIESWHRGGSMVRARRVLDGKNQIVGGEWIEANGSRRTFTAALSLNDTRRAPLSPAGVEGSANGQFRFLEPSAESFLALIPAGAIKQLTTTPVGSDRIAVTYRGDPREDDLVQAAEIILRKTDYHALEQSVRFRGDGNVHQVRVKEVSLESVSAAKVPSGVFEPDAGFADSKAAVATRLVRPAMVRLSDTEAIDLELSVLDRLDRVAALVGREATVTRMADGHLAVRALVADVGRKNVLLASVKGLSDSPAINLDVQTFAEAASPSPTPWNQSLSLRDVMVSGEIAARDDLVRYFLRKDGGLSANTPSSLDGAIRQFANEALSHSRQAVLHAGTVRDLVTRFTPAQLTIMDAPARDRWRNLVVPHLRQVELESGFLRHLLEPVLVASSEAGAESTEAASADIRVAAERLFGSALRHDESVRAAFAVSPRADDALAVMHSDFLRSLHALENLAREIVRQL